MVKRQSGQKMPTYQLQHLLYHPLFLFPAAPFELVAYKINKKGTFQVVVVQSVVEMLLEAWSSEIIWLSISLATVTPLHYITIHLAKPDSC